MKEEAKQIGEAIASHPKTSAVIAASPIYAWINNLNPILDFVATIAGIVLVGVLIRYHWQNTKKIMKENKD
jgi:hypothetical protein